MRDKRLRSSQLEDVDVDVALKLSWRSGALLEEEGWQGLRYGSRKLMMSRFSRRYLACSSSLGIPTTDRAAKAL